MMCDFKKSTECVEMKIHLGKTKILSNQESKKIKEVTIERTCKVSRSKTITFEQQETPMKTLTQLKLKKIGSNT